MASGDIASGAAGGATGEAVAAGLAATDEGSRRDAACGASKDVDAGSCEGGEGEGEEGEGEEGKEGGGGGPRGASEAGAAALRFARSELSGIGFDARRCAVALGRACRTQRNI